jgi:hypothetical protein
MDKNNDWMKVTVENHNITDYDDDDVVDDDDDVMCVKLYDIMHFL